MNRFAFFLSCLAIQAFAAEESAVSPLDVNIARQQFQAAQDICGRDGGRFWGVSLCGPILFVDPPSRQVVANRKDGAGVLKQEGDVFTGVLPTSVNIASTPTQWSGVLWTQIIWPLPNDVNRRNTVLAHELLPSHSK